MSRNLEPKGKIVRRFGVNIYGNPKYDRLLEKRPTPPGPAKRRRPRISEYGQQLAEKQKLRFAYGMTERQFRNAFRKAKGMTGVTGENLLVLLESRLDNVVYRLGMAATRCQARQFVTHGHMTVNGKKVDICSYSVKPGEVISVRAKENSKKFIQEQIASSLSREVPEWLSFSKVDMAGTVSRLPMKTDMSPLADEQLVVELYSK
ncbi:MAG: 30S ribosomal protein S4 [Alteromonas sp.]|nr:30S ribosomal protein S4 [Alteromonas sp.]